MKIIISIFMLIVSIYGYADSIAPPESYILESTDSKLRFAMLAGTAVQTEDGKVYSQSGLYHSDNEEKAIWPFSLYAYGVYLSRDGVYMVDPGPWATHLAGLAVTFYRNGKLLKEYKISDLLTDESAIVRTMSHFFWQKRTGFDDINNTYLIETLAGDTYLFDITTGDIIGKYHKTFPTVIALVQRSDGKKTQVRSLKLCPNVLDVITEFKKGELEPGIIGHLESEYDKKDKNSAIISMVNVPFKHINEITRVNEATESPAKFRLSLKDGEPVNLIVENIYLFCAVDEENNHSKIRINDVSNIKIIDIVDKSPDPSVNNPELVQAIKQFSNNHSWVELDNLVQVAEPDVISDSKFISGRDCKEKLAGQWGRIRRAFCYDLVKAGWRGPLMVVIPENGYKVQKPFAIGMHEISIGDYSKYCVISGKCKAVTDKAKMDEPQTGISFQEAEEYAQWLSQRTGKQYRLPTYNEWAYAANANGAQPRKDFNCRMERDDKIIRGNGILSIKSGQQNGWGLKNYIGNVQEWVIISGNILAVGGHYKIDHEKCDITFFVKHNGVADDVTGFRVLREIE